MTFDETLRALQAEAQVAYGLTAHLEYPGFVTITDPVGRFLIIGQPDGAAEGWRVDVWRTADAHEAGEEPVEVDRLSDPSVPLMVHHALAVAHRVALCAATRS